MKTLLALLSYGVGVLVGAIAFNDTACAQNITNYIERPARLYGDGMREGLSLTFAERDAVKAELGIEHRLTVVGATPVRVEAMCGALPGCVSTYDNGDCVVFLQFGLPVDLEAVAFRDLAAGCIN